MNCLTSIPVYQLLESTSIHTRDAANIILCAAETHPCDEVVLDFSNISFISRSFADQFHKDKLEVITRTGKVIIVENASEEVIKMLQAVARTQVKTNRPVSQVPVYKYTDLISFEKFLVAI